MSNPSYLIKNGLIVNEGSSFHGDIFIKNGKIEQIGTSLNVKADEEIIAEGCYVIPGIIDDQVHFREPGLTHKATIGSEAMAAVAGGVTSFMEMPNTKPPALTQEILEDKYRIASRTSLANYSFFMGTSNDNVEEVLKTDPEKVCGVKIFMGASTGNMLVDSETTLRNVFSRVPLLIATHCEYEPMIRENLDKYRATYGENVPMSLHPDIRSREACIRSSTIAIELAKEYNSRLHILHISTAEECMLFDNTTSLEKKRITAEACVHHLHFSREDYARLGALIKCNPAIKEKTDREAIWQAVLDNHIDIIATDHAPHTAEEKALPYFGAPAGLPLVQHALNMVLEQVQQGRLSLEKMVEKMCHAPATCFRLKDRGFLREGYYADITIIDPKTSWQVSKENILYQCGWSPLEGHKFTGKVTHTFVSGHLAWKHGKFDNSQMGQRLNFHPMS